MKLCLYVNPANARQWIKSLVDRLTTDHDVKIAVVAASESALPSHVEKLFHFERDRLHKGEATSVNRIALDDIAPIQDAAERIDLLVDLVGDGAAPKAARTITILFNGHPGEEALVGSIIGSGIPQIAFRDEKGAITATAQPSSELAVGVTGAMDQTYARLITLLTAYIGNPNRWCQPLIKREVDLPNEKALAARVGKASFKSTLKQAYYMLFRASHWRIGWRWVDQNDVWSRKDLSGEIWQVLKDEETHFYADPVPWVRDGIHYLFFEDLDHKTQKGIISVVSFDEDGKPSPVKPCLEEVYHLSYPFMIEHEGETYMIPETSGNRDVALYKAKDFPLGWERHKVILEDIDAADVTVTKWDGRWWIFCVTRDGAGGYSDCLSIFHADDLLGPWQPHAQNPVLIDTASARPAGNFVQTDGKLFRPVQNCTKSYGAELALVEVTDLTPETYAQEVRANLGPNDHWPGRKLHTLNRAGKLEVIDGAILRPRFPMLRALAERIWKPA